MTNGYITVNSCGVLCKRGTTRARSPCRSLSSDSLLARARRDTPRISRASARAHSYTQWSVHAVPDSIFVLRAAEGPNNESRTRHAPFVTQAPPRHEGRECVLAQPHDCAHGAPNRQRQPRDSSRRTSNAAAPPRQPPSQPPSHVAACHGRCGAGAGPDRPRPRERARVLSGGSRRRGLTGDRRPSRVPHAPSRCARRPRSPRQQQPSGAAWRKRRSCARSWGAGARRWARRARSAHAVRTCRPRRVAARACGGLG